MSESPILSLSVITGVALGVGWCLETFVSAVVPGKMHSTDCQWLGDSAHQNLFSTSQSVTFLVPDKSSNISSRLPSSNSFAVLCSLMGGFPNIQDILEGFSPLENAQGCKNEKAQLPTLVSVSMRTSGLSALPDSFLSSSTRTDRSLHFRFHANFCESLQLIAGCTIGVDLMIVCLCLSAAAAGNLEWLLPYSFMVGTVRRCITL